MRETMRENKYAKYLGTVRIRNSLYELMKRGDVTAELKGAPITNPEDFLKLPDNVQDEIEFKMTKHGKDYVETEMLSKMPDGLKKKGFKMGDVIDSNEDIKEELIGNITEQVANTIFEGIKKGEVEFANQPMTADEWFALSDEEKEKHPIRWKKNTNPLMETLTAQLIKEDKLVKDIKSEGGEVKFELTSDGESMRAMGQLMGIDMKRFFNTVIEQGVSKKFSSYVWIDKDVMIEGYSRMQVSKDGK